MAMTANRNGKSIKIRMLIVTTQNVKAYQWKQLALPKHCNYDWENPYSWFSYIFTTILARIFLPDIKMSQVNKVVKKIRAVWRENSRLLTSHLEHSAIADYRDAININCIFSTTLAIFLQCLQTYIEPYSHDWLIDWLGIWSWLCNNQTQETI